MEMGCRMILRSNSPRRVILISAMNETSTSMGSVGKERPAPPVKSVRLMDIGVAKTMNHMAQSNRYKEIQTSNNAGGNRKAYQNSYATASPTNGKVTRPMMASQRFDIWLMPNTG